MNEQVCGRIWLAEKVYEDAAYTVVGLGSIRIRVYEAWAGDVAERAAVIRTAHPSASLRTGLTEAIQYRPSRQT